jgi:hypothetical protein
VRKFRGVAWGLALLAVACARTGLYPGDLGDEATITDPNVTSGGSASVAGAPTLGGAGIGGMLMPAGMPPVVAGAPPQCVPTAESCNGVDDDCNGAVDDLPAEACPGGGFRFCVAGRLSECPRRCEVCVPGSIRVCQNSFCSFWGEQECSGDGLGFSHCREATPPSQCADIARQFKDSKELEQCCLDQGWCCVDSQDLDHDGDRREMLGRCEDVVCQ